MNSSASDASNVGPAERSQLFSECFVKRMATCAPASSLSQTP